MNNYHIYEEILSHPIKGNNTQYNTHTSLLKPSPTAAFPHTVTLFKARQKGTLNYFTIQRLDVTSKAHVLPTVTLQHQLTQVFSQQHLHLSSGDWTPIPLFVNWYETRQHLWIVQGLVSGVTLRELLNANEKLPESTVRRLSIDILNALQFCHSQNVLINVLNVDSCRCDLSGRVRIYDLQCASRIPVSEEDERQRRQRINNQFVQHSIAPELLADEGLKNKSLTACASFAADIYAFACLIYELLTGKTPTPTRIHTKSFVDLNQTTAIPLPAELNLSAACCDFVMRCLQPSPTKRIQWSEALQHQWLTSANIELHQYKLPDEPLYEQLQQQHFLCQLDKL